MVALHLLCDAAVHDKNTAHENAETKELQQAYAIARLAENIWQPKDTKPQDGADHGHDRTKETHSTRIIPSFSSSVSVPWWVRCDRYGTTDPSPKYRGRAIAARLFID